MKILFCVQVLSTLSVCLGQFGLRPALESTGNCRFVAGRELIKVGCAIVRLETIFRWIDPRSRNIRYCVFESTDGERALFATFGASPIMQYDRIKIQLPYTIIGHNPNTGQTGRVHTQYSEMHCLGFKYRYLNDLKSGVKRQRYNPHEDPPLAVVHYSSGPMGAYSSNPPFLCWSTLIMTLLAVFICQ